MGLLQLFSFICSLFPIPGIGHTFGDITSPVLAHLSVSILPQLHNLFNCLRELWVFQGLYPAIVIISVNTQGQTKASPLSISPGADSDTPGHSEVILTTIVHLPNETVSYAATGAPD